MFSRAKKQKESRLSSSVSAALIRNRSLTSDGCEQEEVEEKACNEKEIEVLEVERRRRIGSEIRVLRMDAGFDLC